MARQRQKAKTTAPMKVVVDIKPEPVSPAQRAAWKRLWDKLLSEMKADSGSEKRGN